MNILMPEKLLTMLMMATPTSIIVMAIIQKFKGLSFVKNINHIFILNFVFSLIIGTFFSMTFYEIPLQESIWVSFLSFIGAPSIYELLKKQNIINYTPRQLTGDDSKFVAVPIENEIKRDGEK